MKRLPAIDIVRGLVVVLMVMHHSLDSWTLDTERQGTLWIWLRHLGGLPAPGFMMLAGLSAAIVLERERRKGLGLQARTWGGLQRGLYVLGIAFAFRVFAFVAGGNPLSNWEMIFRVDVLNCMGVALLLVAGLGALARTRTESALIAGVLTLAFALPAPLLWGCTITWPTALLGNYVAGSGPLVLFPLFPWVAFTAAGFLVGLHLTAKERSGLPYLLAGGAIFLAGFLLGRAPFDLYPPHDYWKSSPLFVFMRMAIQLALLGGAMLVCRARPAGGPVERFLELLGRHSLLAYILHLELAYGRLAHPLFRRLPVGWGLCGTALLVALCWAAAQVAERRDQRKKLRPAPSPSAAPAPAPAAE